MKQSYTPSDKILEKYAELLVKFGLQRPDGTQLPKGSLVHFKVPEVAKPLYYHIQNTLLRLNYQPLGEFIPSSDELYRIDQSFYLNANKAQLEYIPTKLHEKMIDTIDATILVVAETDMYELDSVDGKKVMARNAAMTPVKDRKMKKIDAGKLSWTIALYGTDHMAKEANMSPRAFWNQIIRACYLDESDPVKEWKRIDRTNKKTAKKLDELKIKELHWKGADMDIRVGIGEDRLWETGGGNNIPSYEVFTSPNMHQVNGWIKFNQPHFRYGKRIEGIELWFKDGKVVRSKATKNHDLLKSMLKTPGGDQLGEVSLTDTRISRITKPTGDIMYDENMGGKYGNTHMAIGSSFHSSYSGKIKKPTKKQWEKLGFNDSVVHSDFVSTTNRTVTATLYDGTEKVIYKDGKFTL